MTRQTLLQTLLGVLSISLAGCATTEGRFIVHPIAEDAPVQIVSVVPSRYNLFAQVIVKNTTDRPVLDFYVAWTIIRPKNCGASPSPARLGSVVSQSAYAEARGTGTLPPGHFWGSRPLQPHEQTEITSLSLTRDVLEKMAQLDNARKLLVQILVSYVNFMPENVGPRDGFTHNGPDWRSTIFETRQHLFDPDDAEQQACG